MTRKIWTFRLEDGVHRVELDHGYMSGKRSLTVDGVVADQSSRVKDMVFDTGSTHSFQIGKHECALDIATNGVTFTYNLTVDGFPVEESGETSGAQFAATSQPSGNAPTGERGQWGSAFSSGAQESDWRPDPVQAQAQTKYTQQRNAVVAQLKSGANWFYWIAGLSLFNSLIFFLGSDRGFALGLGMTEFIDGFGQVFAERMGEVYRYAAFALDIAVIGLFVFLGYSAGKRHAWAFIIGMLLFSLDGLLLLLVKDWLSVGVHLLALFYLMRGFQANIKLRNLEQAQVLAPYGA
jgi:hypothetical protein